MKRIVLAAAIPLLLQMTGCSQGGDIDEANKKIAALEAQLAAEKAKNAVAAPPPVAPERKATAVGSPTPAPAPVAEEAPSGTQWSYSADEDKMTGGTTYHAVVQSTNTVNFAFPYSGDQNASLRLRTDPKYGKDVMFAIEKGQILCRSYQDCEVLIRFDDEKPQTYSAVGAADNSSEVIFIRNYRKFVEKMAKAKMVRIAVNIHKQGAPVFEFDVSGFSPKKYQAKS